MTTEISTFAKLVLFASLEHVQTSFNICKFLSSLQSFNMCKFQRLQIPVLFADFQHVHISTCAKSYPLCKSSTCASFNICKFLSSLQVFNICKFQRLQIPVLSADSNMCQVWHLQKSIGSPNPRDVCSRMLCFACFLTPRAPSQPPRS